MAGSARTISESPSTRASTGGRRGGWGRRPPAEPGAATAPRPGPAAPGGPRSGGLDEGAGTGPGPVRVVAPDQGAERVPDPLGRGIDVHDPGPAPPRPGPRQPWSQAVRAATMRTGSSAPQSSRAECMASWATPTSTVGMPQPGGGERPDGGAARDLVVADEVLHRDAGGVAGQLEGGLGGRLGGVALVGVDLDHRAAVEGDRGGRARGGRRSWGGWRGPCRPRPGPRRPGRGAGRPGTPPRAAVEAFEHLGEQGTGRARVEPLPTSSWSNRASTAPDRTRLGGLQGPQAGPASSTGRRAGRC